MKYIIQFTLNLLILTQYFFVTIFLLIWHGKLVKVSPYHLCNNKLRQPTVKDCMNEYFQRDIYPASEKQREVIIDEVLNKLLNHPDFAIHFSDITLKLYNKNFKPIGTTSVHSVLEYMLEDIKNK